MFISVFAQFVLFIFRGTYQCVHVTMAGWGEKSNFTPAERTAVEDVAKPCIHN